MIRRIGRPHAVAALEQKNIAETMRDTMENFGNTDIIETNNRAQDLTTPFLISVPKGRDIRDMTGAVRDAATHLKPSHKFGTAKFTTLESFVDWTNRFKRPESVIFAEQDQSCPSLTSIIDYHPGGAVEIDAQIGDPNARHCRHRGRYAFPVSEEWTIWNKVSKGTLSKTELGEFIENNAKDIIDPSAALLGSSNTNKAEPWEQKLIEIAAKLQGRYGQFSKLMEMSRHLEIYETSNLITTCNPDDGSAKLSFESENKDAMGRPLQIPNLFLIAIPVFDQGAHYRLPVRFSFKKSGNSVSFRLTLYNPAVAFYDAIKETVNAAQEQTELSTFYGHPEDS